MLHGHASQEAIRFECAVRGADGITADVESRGYPLATDGFGRGAAAKHACQGIESNAIAGSCEIRVGEQLANLSDGGAVVQTVVVTLGLTAG